MCEFEIGKNMRLFRATAEQAEQPGRDTLKQYRLADDQRDRDQGVDFHVMQVQILKPRGKVMKDEEEISRDERAIDGQLEQERAQGFCSFSFHSGTGGASPSLRRWPRYRSRGNYVP